MDEFGNYDPDREVGPPSTEWNSQDDSDWYGEVYDDDDPNEPPPAEDYCAPGFTAGPSGSGGWTTHGRLWSRLQSSTEHRQTADALSAWQRPDGRWEVALAGTHSLTVYRFPGADQEEEPLPRCCIQQVSTPYTIARSSDGITVVSGRDHGIVSVFTLNEARPEPHARLEALLYLGHHGVPPHNNMVNCLRFFQLAGKEYLLAAGQDKYLYILQNPNTEQNTRTGERQEGQQYFPRAWPRSEPLEHCAVRADVPIMALTSSLSVNAHTPAIGPFPEPCNTAQPSPCAGYIAVLIDAPEVYVLLRADNFSLGRAKRLPFLLDDRPSWADRPWASEDDVGGQYCAWSPASDLLAVSSDGFHAVLIWSVPSFQQVMSIKGTLEPALSITFSPCEPRLLVFCERSGRLYITDVFEELRPEELRDPKWEPARTLQCISRHAEVADIRPADGVLVPAGAAEPDFPIGRLDGLAVTTDGRILAATREGLLEIPLLKPWSLHSHRFFPARFKVVARTVLLCASRATDDIQGLALAELPKDVVLKVIHHLAASYKSCFPPGAYRPTLSRQHYL